MNKNLISIKFMDLSDSTFMFYLNNKYRKFLFSRLKYIYGDWKLVAKKIGIDTRFLFRLRRGFENKKSKKIKSFLNYQIIIKIGEILSIDLEEIEKQIKIIKSGHSGIQSEIALPIKVQLNKKNICTLEQSLGEYVYSKIKTEKIIFKKPDFLKNENYFYLNIVITSDKLEKLRLSGLNPKYLEEQNKYLISYRVPGTNLLTQKIVPKYFVFDEVAAKEFGKWLGDRCGGTNKIGISNKNFNFIEEFYYFLNSKLQQPFKDIKKLLSCKANFIPSQEITVKIYQVYTCKTQLGDYAYRIDLSNKILKNLVFDFVENNIFELLYHSKKEVRYAFYAGYFEAEGSISNDNILSFAFGLDFKGKKNYLSLLDRVIKFNKLLNLDSFNSRISRKVANTNKSSILKYDLNLLNSLETREREISFINSTFFKYITHQDKIKKFDELKMAIVKTKKAEIKKNSDNNVHQPEVDIGLVGQ